MNKLDRLRLEIDRIDDNLVLLFEERMALALEVADYKRSHGLPVFNNDRECQVIDLCLSKLKDSRLSNVLERWIRFTMKLSRDVQNSFLSDK